MTVNDSDSSTHKADGLAGAVTGEIVPDGGLLVSHAAMNAAYDNGEALPLGQSVSWIVRYRDTWWVVYEHGWLRITDEATTADLDRIAPRLNRADVTAASTDASRPVKPAAERPM
jgi:hypothetical protein